MFSDVDIEHAVQNNILGIDPYDPKSLQPASYDVHLGSQVLFFNQTYDLIDPEETTRHMVNRYEIRQEIVILPDQFVLGSTIEKVRIPRQLSCRFEGRSTLGRVGMMTHITAGFIDPGFEGTITLEIVNVGTLPIVLRKGMSIGQLCFYELKTPARNPYGSAGLGSKYQGQSGPTASEAL